MPSGLPRPIVENRPVPWSARFERDPEKQIVVNFSAMDDTRGADSYFRRSCALCGDQVEDEVAVIATADRKVVDGVVMHLRCAKLAHRHCPHLAHGYTIWMGDDADLEKQRHETMPALVVPDEFRPIETRTDGKTVRYSSLATSA